MGIALFGQGKLGEATQVSRTGKHCTSMRVIDGGWESFPLCVCKTLMRCRRLQTAGRNQLVPRLIWSNRSRMARPWRSGKILVYARSRSGRAPSCSRAYFVPRHLLEGGMVVFECQPALLNLLAPTLTWLCPVGAATSAKVKPGRLQGAQHQAGHHSRGCPLPER